MVTTNPIPNSYYETEGGVRLLSPQHLDQASKYLTDIGDDTNGVQCTLYWNKKKQKLTIPITSRNNCATFQLALGYESYRSFYMQAEIPEHDQYEILYHSAETLFDEETELFVPYCSESTGRAICKETVSFAIDGPSTLPIKTSNEHKNGHNQVVMA